MPDSPEGRGRARIAIYCRVQGTSVTTSGTTSNACCSGDPKRRFQQHQPDRQQIVQRQLNIQPTLTIRPGFPVHVIVTRDLVLAPYSQGGPP